MIWYEHSIRECGREYKGGVKGEGRSVVARWRISAFENGNFCPASLFLLLLG